MANYFESQSTLHVAIIMDGNGRWALARGLPQRGRPPRRRGSRAPGGGSGARAGIGILTLFAFSSRQLAARTARKWTR